jgi:hypothetical protein
MLLLLLLVMLLLLLLVMLLLLLLPDVVRRQILARRREVVAAALVVGEAVEVDAVRRRLVELLRLHVHAVLRLLLRLVELLLLLVAHGAGIHGLLAMVELLLLVMLLLLLLLLLLYLLLLEVIARSRVCVHLLVMVVVVMLLLLVSLARKGLSRRQRPPERHRTVSICRSSCWWENEALRSQVSCHAAFRLVVDFIGFFSLSFVVVARSARCHSESERVCFFDSRRSRNPL